MRKIFSRVGMSVTAALFPHLFSHSVLCATIPEKTSIKKQNLEFTLQENLEPWDLAECEHEPENNSVDWLVTCKLGSTKHVFRVHLVIQQYKKTRYGQSAFEILYWVTDATRPRYPTHTSSTVWIHNRQAEVQATVMELAQGVENDLKSLRLKVSL